MNTKLCLACNTEYKDESIERCPSDGVALISLIPHPAVLNDARFDDFELIGRGRYSAIYLATQKSDKKPVVLKFIGDQSVETLHMYAEEAECLSKLDHKGVVRLLDSGQKTDCDYLLVLEYIGSETVQTLIDKQKIIPAQQVCSIMSQVCDALACLYENGQVHPFLKPSHIVLRDSDQTPVLIDFAKQYYAHDIHTFSVGASIVANGEYAAPEVLVGGPLTESSNIYALGCMMYTMLFGQPPFVHENQLELARMHLLAEVSFPTQLIRSLDIPRPLVRLIMLMLMKEPDLRPSSVRELKRYLS